MASYETMTEAIKALKEEGYTTDFNLQENHIHCPETNKWISAEEFVVDKFYRFEGDSDPADEAIVYAISSHTHLVKGLLVNGYGIYTDTVSNEMIQKLRIA